MGVSCLGRPRQTANIMNNKDTPDLRYQKNKKTTSAQPGKGVVGQSDGNRLKINRSLLSCSICMQNYNTAQREPVFVCSNNHTFCKECILNIQVRSNKCPDCRQPLITKVRNRDVFQLIEDNQNIIAQNQMIEVDINQHLNNKISLHPNTSNHSISSFWIQQNRIMKVRNDKIWEGFVSLQTLPKDQQCCFQVKVLASKHNNIEVGIVGQGYKMQRNITCKESVVYHLADGMILSGVKGKQSSQWKEKGQVVINKCPFVLQVRVDGRKGSVSWWCKGKQLGFAQFSGYMLRNNVVAYVMMCHQNDIVQFSH